MNTLSTDQSVSSKDTGGTTGSAFPFTPTDRSGQIGDAEPGLTPRQYAAIHLRVPNSGTDWLDEMIVESQRNELMERIVGGLSEARGLAPRDFPELARMIADATLKARQS